MPITKRRVKRSSGKPRLVNPVTRRVTATSTNGDEYAVLFGAGATPILMYLAAHPDAEVPQMMSALGRKSRGPVVLALNRLERLGLAVKSERDWLKKGARTWNVNPRLRSYDNFVALLRKLAAMHGMCLRPAAPGAHDRDRDLPHELFWTKTRSKILLLVSLLGELYLFELCKVVRNFTQQMGLLLDDFEAEGVLKCEYYNGAFLRRLNPAYPAIAELRALSDDFASEWIDVRKKANFLQVLRQRPRGEVSTKRANIVRGLEVRAAKRSERSEEEDVG